MAAKRKKLKRGTNPQAQPRAQVSLYQGPHGDMGATGPANKARESVVQPAYDDEIDPTTGETQSRNPNGVKRVRFLDMLETYHKEGVISDRGCEAGKKLRDAWATTQRGAGVDFSQDKVDSSPKPDAQAAIRADRMTAYVRIKRMIPAADDAILMAVVCEGHSIASLRQYRRGRLDAGKAHLWAALERLANKLRY